MALIDLETISFEKLTSSASFWHIICILFTKFLFDLFKRFLTSDDLEWPRDKLFWKIWRRKLILTHSFTTFNRVRNLSFLTFFRCLWPRVTLKILFFWKCDVKSFILTYNFPTFATLKFDSKKPSIKPRRRWW